MAEELTKEQQETMDAVNKILKKIDAPMSDQRMILMAILQGHASGVVFVWRAAGFILGMVTSPLFFIHYMVVKPLTRGSITKGDN